MLYYNYSMDDFDIALTVIGVVCTVCVVIYNIYIRLYVSDNYSSVSEL